MERDNSVEQIYTGPKNYTMDRDSAIYMSGDLDPFILGSCECEIYVSCDIDFNNTPPVQDNPKKEKRHSWLPWKRNKKKSLDSKKNSAELKTDSSEQRCSQQLYSMGKSEVKIIKFPKSDFQLINTDAHEKKVALNVTLNKCLTGELIYIMKDEKSVWHEITLCTAGSASRRQFVLHFNSDDGDYEKFDETLKRVFSQLEFCKIQNKALPETYVLVAYKENGKRNSAEQEENRKSQPQDEERNNPIQNNFSEKNDEQEKNQPVTHSQSDDISNGTLPECPYKEANVNRKDPETAIAMPPPFSPAPFQTPVQAPKENETFNFDDEQANLNFENERLDSNIPSWFKIQPSLNSFLRQIDNSESVRCGNNVNQSIVSNQSDYLSMLPPGERVPQSESTFNQSIVSNQSDYLSMLPAGERVPQSESTFNQSIVSNQSDYLSMQPLKNCVRQSENTVNPTRNDNQPDCLTMQPPAGSDSQSESTLNPPETDRKQTDYSTFHQPPDESEPRRFICLGQMLELAINNGDKEKAKNYAALLAENEVKVKIKVDTSASNDKSSENSEFSIKVYLEDPSSSGGCIILKVRSSDTIRDLKYRMFVKYRFPIEVQCWIIGARIPNDTDTLRQCQVTSNGTAVYLYLTPSQSAGLARENYENRQRHTEDLISQDNVEKHMEPQEQSCRDSGDYLRMTLSPDQKRLVRENISGSSQEKTQTGSTINFKDVFEQSFNSSDKSQDSKYPSQNIPEQSNTNIQSNQRLAQEHESTEHYRVSEHDLNERPELSASSASSSEIGWLCPACTYLNVPTRPGCEICATDRPADYQVPDDHSNTENRRKERDKKDTSEDVPEDNVEKLVDPQERCDSGDYLHMTLSPDQKRHILENIVGSNQENTTENPADYENVFEKRRNSSNENQETQNIPEQSNDTIQSHQRLGQEHERTEHHRVPIHDLNERPDLSVSSALSAEAWQCPACTFLNVSTRPGCEICATERPAEYQIPKDNNNTENRRKERDKEDTSDEEQEGEC